MKWFYVINDSCHGPADDHGMKTLIEDKQITLKTLVWNETFSEWVQAGQTELVQYFEMKNPEPPPIPQPAMPQSNEKYFYRFWKNPVSLVTALGSAAFCGILASVIFGTETIIPVVFAAFGIGIGNFVYDALDKKQR